MVKKALLIGINYYSTPSARLNGCINDIVGMKNTLIQNYGYTEKDIIVLRDDINDASRLPTAANIMGYLSALVYYSGSYEEIWVHYSGHGSRIRDTSGDEKSGLDSVIVPANFASVGVITDDYIYNILKNSKTRTVALFDSCNSGTVCDLQWSFEYVGGSSFSRSQNNNLAISNKNIFMISGSKDTQTSADIYDTVDKQYEGAFTNEFLNALKKYNYSGSIFDIYKQTCNNLSAARYSQKPIFSSSSQTPAYLFKKIAATTSKLVASNTSGSRTTTFKMLLGVSGAAAARGGSAPAAAKITAFGSRAVARPRITMAGLLQ
jgi:hypothetical protein